MSWSIGWDSDWHRDIGYGVPCECDHPDCHAKIDRGLAYVCGGEPYGGEHGCGLYFCYAHLGADRCQLCEQCSGDRPPFPAKPDVQRWRRHKLRDPSWRQWREENPEEAAALKIPTAPRGKAITP